MKTKTFIILFVSCIIMSLLPLITSSTTFFEDDFFIMVNHSFVKEGGGGGAITTPVEEIPEIVVEAAVEVAKKIPIYTWFIVTFLFLFVWRGRKRRCSKCRKKFKKRYLTLYKGKRYCKECLNIQKNKK